MRHKTVIVGVSREMIWLQFAPHIRQLYEPHTCIHTGVSGCDLWTWDWDWDCLLSLLSACRLLFVRVFGKKETIFRFPFDDKMCALALAFRDGFDFVPFRGICIYIHVDSLADTNFLPAPLTSISPLEFLGTECIIQAFIYVMCEFAMREWAHHLPQLFPRTPWPLFVHGTISVDFTIAKRGYSIRKIGL